MMRRIRRDRAEVAALQIRDGHAGDDIPMFQADFMRQSLLDFQKNRKRAPLLDFMMIVGYW